MQATIDTKELEQLASDLLSAGGFTQTEAQLTARSLVQSNLRGYDSHGVVRVQEYLDALRQKELVSGAEWVVLNQSPSALWVDAGRGLGQVQMPRLLEQLEVKSRESAVAVGVMHSCGHVGRLGEWVEHLARRGLAAFMAVNDNGAVLSVAPPGGKEARTSTNPLAFGIPLPEGAESFVLDLSTSLSSLGRIRLAHLSGEVCNPDFIQDAMGRPTSDPSVLFNEPRGALRPMAAYKGFGLAMMIDCLVAGLSGGFAPPAPEGTPALNNVLVAAWNPAHFAGLPHMQEQAEKYLRFVSETEPTDPHRPVQIAGDRSKAERARRERDGIPLSQGLRQLLSSLARELGVSVPEGLS